jgi:chromosome partitioning protein
MVGTGAVRLVTPGTDSAESEIIDDNPQPVHEGSFTASSADSVDSETEPVISEPAPEELDGGHEWDRTRTEEIPVVKAAEGTLRAPAPSTEAEPEEVEAPPPVTVEPESDEAPSGSAASRSAESHPVDETAATAPEDGPAAQAASGNPLPRVIAVANQKGGVGKTTTSVNLGAALAELGFRVLVVDLDPQGNATTGLGIDARHFEQSMYDVLMRDTSLEDCVEPTSLKNLFVAPATIALAGAEIELVPAFSRELKLRRAIESVLDDFDFILIDCPPSLGLITVNALAAASEVLVPIQCEYYALEGLSQLTRNVHLVASNLNPKLDISTIVLTMYDARTKLADEVAGDVREHFGTKVCRIVIPRTVRLSEAPSFGQPITAFDPSSRGAVAYRELAKEVSGGTS